MPPQSSSKTYNPNYWYILGHAYDLQLFLQQHPGGPLALTLGRGRDATNLLRTYHKTSLNNLIQRIQKYRLNGCYYDPYGDYDGPIYEVEDDFVRDIKNMVTVHARRNGTGCLPWVALFVTACLFVAAWLLSRLLGGCWKSGVAFGAVMWIPASVVSHDAAHFACVSNWRWNRRLSWLCCPLYFNSGLWLLQHVVSHHQFTNDERDVDLGHGFGIVRMSQGETWKRWMRWFVVPFLFVAQLFFSTLAETIFYPAVVLWDYWWGCEIVFKVIPNKRNVVEMCLQEIWVQLCLSVVFVLWPFLHGGYSWGQAYSLGILPFHITSVIFILATQFAHLTGATMRRKTDGETDLQVSSIRRQVAMSLDVNPESRISNLLLGGLNTQSLHHVVPRFNSGRFPDVYREYARICEKHGVRRNLGTSVLWGFVEYVKYMMTVNFRDDFVEEDDCNKIKSTMDDANSKDYTTKDRENMYTVDQVSMRQDVIVIDNVVYDIKMFKKQHPGGNVISILEGLDVSNVFYSTHRNGVKRLEESLEKFRIGYVRKGRGSVPTTALRAQPEADAFLFELNTVLKYKIIPNSTHEISMQAQRVRIRTLSMWTFSFAVAFIFPRMHLAIRLAAATLAAACSCSLVGQIAHEDTHGVLRFSGRRIPPFVISTFWAIFWPLMSEPYFKFEHTTHHVDPLNPDFDYEVTGLSYFMRYSKEQPWYPWHAWQHWYGFVIYGFYIVLQTVLEFPLRFFRNFNRTYERQLLHYYNWTISFLFYFFLPKQVGGLDGQTHWKVFFCFMYVWQLMLYLVAAINHAIEYDGNETTPEKYKNVWSYSVLKNTSNFCVDSTFWHWMSGGFYIQNEHHLLSWIPQEYLRLAVEPTKALCKKFGYPYNEFDSFQGLLSSHYRKLRALGRQPASNGKNTNA